jgi:hypothetical protein
MTWHPTWCHGSWRRRALTQRRSASGTVPGRYSPSRQGVPQPAPEGAEVKVAPAIVPAADRLVVVEAARATLVPAKERVAPG